MSPRRSPPQRSRSALADAGRRRAGAGLRRWGDRLPRVPEGDIVVAGEAAFRASYVVGAALERVDVQLRQWPAAGLALVTLVVAIGAAALLGR